MAANYTELTSLNPLWMENSNGKYAFIFECPVCSSGHGIAVPFRDCQEARDLTKYGTIWKWTSGTDFKDVTVEPSINFDLGYGCPFHGFVTDGKVLW